jgi:hypothetical protein
LPACRQQRKTEHEREKFCRLAIHFPEANLAAIRCSHEWYTRCPAQTLKSREFPEIPADTELGGLESEGHQFIDERLLGGCRIRPPIGCGWRPVD